jgi:hypothetical protein
MRGSHRDARPGRGEQQQHSPRHAEADDDPGNPLRLDLRARQREADKRGRRRGQPQHAGHAAREIALVDPREADPLPRLQ